MSFVTLMVELSLDGKLTEARGLSSKSFYRFQDKGVRDFTHRVRSMNDCIVIGKNTLANDNPYLSVDQNLYPGKKISKVVVGSNLDLSFGLNMFDGNGDVYAFGENDIRNLGGAVPIRCARNDISAAKIINELYGIGLHRVLVEGGTTLINCFLEEMAFQKLIVKRLPIVVGEAGDEFTTAHFSSVRKLKLISIDAIGSTTISEYENVIK